MRHHRMFIYVSKYGNIVARGLCVHVDFRNWDMYMKEMIELD